MDWSALVNAYLESKAGETYGPGWREKIDLLRAQAERMRADEERLKTIAARPKLYSATIPHPTDPTRPLEKLFTEDEMRTGVPGYVAPSKTPPRIHSVAIPDPTNPSRPITKGFTDEELARGVPTWKAPQDPPDRYPGVSRQMVVNGVLGDWFPETQKFVPSPAGARTVVDERKAAETKDLMGTLDVLMTKADADLKRYEGSMTGFSRYVPSALNAEKAVARNAYLSTLGSMAQIFGRGILSDNRVSNEDRQAYANTIGLQGEIIMTLEPEEARRRMDVMRQLITSKYGRLNADAEGNPIDPAGVGGGGDNLGGLDPRDLVPVGR